MQRIVTSLLVMMLYLASSNSSAQQFESFRQVGATTGMAAGNVTSITLAPASEPMASSISFFDAAGLSTVYDISFSPSTIIRDTVQVYLPSEGFSNNAPGMDLDEVGFYTGTLLNATNPDSNVPAHWFRLTFYNGVWSGSFRIADRIYAIDRSRPDNIVEVRNTPSLNTTLRPTRQIKITAIVDEAFVFADSVGDSVGLDNLGHIHALESLHVMEGVMNDSLGISAVVDQLVYRLSSELASPQAWLENNATSFGIDDNYASFIFRGNESVQPLVNRTPTNSFIVQTRLDFKQLTSAHLFGRLLGVVEEDNTLQSSVNPLNAAHWSTSQRTALLSNLPNATLIQTISSDAPEIEVTETDEIINPIPQSILDSESVEGTGQNNGGLLQSDETDTDTINNANQSTESSGGGSLGSASLLNLLLIGLLFRRRTAQVVRS